MKIYQLNNDNTYFYKLYKKEYGKIMIYIITTLSIILSITAFLSPGISNKLTYLATHVKLDCLSLQSCKAL